MSDNTHNIPTMSTGTMAKQLTELYTQAYRNHTLPFLPSVALWGCLLYTSPSPRD